MTATARRCNWRGVAAGARRQAPDRRSAEARRRDVIVRGHQPAHLSYVFVDGLVCGDVRGEHEARQVPIVPAGAPSSRRRSAPAGGGSRILLSGRDRSASG
jgi:hypothetical protein